MKVLFLGVFRTNSTNNSQARGLESIGCDVLRYDYRARGHNVDEVVDLAQSTGANLLLLSKCNRMSSRVITDSGVPSCLWYMDAMNNFNGELQEKIKLATYCCFGLEVPYREGKALNPRSYFVHQCYDETEHMRLDVVDQDIDVSFIGNIRHPDHRRNDYTKADPRVQLMSGVYGLDHSKVVCRSKINLNFNIKGAGTSVRTHKIMASGGFVLTTPWDGMEESFEIGKHLDVFNSAEEMRDKITYYLEHESERNAIAEASFERRERFSPTAWARGILQGMEP